MKKLSFFSHALFMQNVLILEHVNALNFVNNEYTISGS